MYTVEDYIELLAGIQHSDKKFDIDKSDYNLITSFARQTFKGTGFTDRQYELAKQKLSTYKDQFEQNGYITLVADFDNLRYPLRQIDRSRYIHVIEQNDTYKIAVRFTFQKKLISALEEMRRATQETSDYDKINKIHYFEYSEETLFRLISIFKDKHFELNDLAKEIYDKISEFKEEDYIPGVYDYQLKNVSSNAVDYITSQLGEPNQENILRYVDRSKMHGLLHFDEQAIATSASNYNQLSYKIAKRNNRRVRVLSTTYNTETLLQSLLELNRFPLMFIVPSDKAYDTVVSINEHIRNIIPAEQVSVMFRLDNLGEGLEFNNFIKSQKINNRLDSNTQVVYTLDTKVPKPLLNSNWTPEAVVVYGRNSIPSTRKVLDCFTDKDLIIFYEDSDGPSTRFFYDRQLETI